jgi:hypothetical protein
MAPTGAIVDSRLNRLSTHQSEMCSRELRRLAQKLSLVSKVLMTSHKI